MIPANINLVGIETEKIEEEGKEFLLKNALDPLKDEYDFILIECLCSEFLLCKVKTSLLIRPAICLKFL